MTNRFDSVRVRAMSSQHSSYIGYQKGELCVENRSVGQLAQEFGTPLYIYSATAITDNFRRLTGAFRTLTPTICYAVKANSNIALLQLLAEEGAHFDVVSGGELQKVLRARVPAQRVVFSGVGKTDDELELAVSVGVGFVNVESAPELQRLAAIAAAHRAVTNVLLRVNPRVDAKTHRFITTGTDQDKFGISPAEIPALASQVVATPSLRFCGLHCHIGSQITTVEPYVMAIEKINAIVQMLANAGIAVEVLNFGGGFGIPYGAADGLTLPTIEQFANDISRALKRPSARVFFEPGRFIVGDAGVLITKVIYVKDTGSKRFAIVDAGMNDLIRPALYGAYHDILAVSVAEPSARPAGLAASDHYDVVGPVCESTDCFGRDRELQTLASGDYLAIMSVGAYGFALSSNYNARPRAAEVLVRGTHYQIIRVRESIEDLCRNERELSSGLL